MVGLLASPLVVLRQIVWKRQALKLNSERRCGRCKRLLGIDPLYLYGGVYVCPDCATRHRTRLQRLLPATFTLAGILALTSATAFVVSSLDGRPWLAWWLDGRWFPLILPSVGLALATAIAITIGRRANQLRGAKDARELKAELDQRQSMLEQPSHARVE